MLIDAVRKSIELAPKEVDDEERVLGPPFVVRRLTAPHA